MKNLFKVGVVALATFLAVGPSQADEAEATVAPAKKPLKVLMIGNSFSVCLLKEMPNVAKDLDLPLDLCSLYIGGCSLQRHLQNIQDPEARPYSVTWSYVSTDHDAAPIVRALTEGKDKRMMGNIPSMLKADAWDVVTIQQASHQSWQPFSYEPYGTDVLATIKELAPQAKIYVQQTWSYTPWDGRLKAWHMDQNVMFDLLEGAYDAFAKKHNLPQILTGKAVQRYRKELPVVYTEKSNDDDVCGTTNFVEKDGKWSPKGDVFHFNAKGHFLQALVWTARLFDVDVTKGTYLPESMKDHPERAALMRKIASELR